MQLRILFFRLLGLNRLELNMNLESYIVQFIQWQFKLQQDFD
jgi:hypothetical protein